MTNEIDYQVLAAGLDKIFNGTDRTEPKTIGFILLVFPFGETSFEGRVNYVSNGADRKDMIIMMKEMIARFEGRVSTVGHT